MNASTLEEVAKCLLSSGGIANARIQLGDIIRPKDDFKVKDVIKNIRRRHQFVFKDNKIIVHNLPGFGKGEFYTIDKDLIDATNVPKFVYTIVNRDKLTEDFKCKKSFINVVKCRKCHYCIFLVEKVKMRLEKFSFRAKYQLVFQTFSSFFDTKFCPIIFV